MGHYASFVIAVQALIHLFVICEPHRTRYRRQSIQEMSYNMWRSRLYVLIALALALVPFIEANEVPSRDGPTFTAEAADLRSGKEDKGSHEDSLPHSEAAKASAGLESNHLPDDATPTAKADSSLDSLPVSTDDSTAETEPTTPSNVPQSTDTYQKQQQQPPVQSGPLVDLLGSQLLSMEMIDDTHAQLVPHNTNEALHGKKIIGIYVSASWCGPCRAFTPELMEFYKKMNARKGREDEFQIVWISRCRDMDSYTQYFAKMHGWLALPPQEAMGERGRWLSDKYGVKSIPSLVLVDDMGQLITKDARNKIPADRAGIGFPWRNPVANIYMTLVPRSVRFMINSQVVLLKDKMMAKIKALIPTQAKATTR
jgi:nucleoredoxin